MFDIKPVIFGVSIILILLAIAELYQNWNSRSWIVRAFYTFSVLLYAYFVYDNYNDFIECDLCKKHQ